MALELPAWVRVGSRVKWWSESQKAYHNVVITTVETEKRQVLVRFEADQRVWKKVPFGLLLGAESPLRPADAAPVPGETRRFKDGGIAVVSGGLPEVATITSAEAAEAKDAAAAGDGTATPPWYEQLNHATGREEKKQEKMMKEQETVSKQMERQQRWQQAQRAKHEAEKRQKEEERRRREAEAEQERLRILERLKKERALEEVRQAEVRFMQMEDAWSAKYINEPLWREARRIREEEEERRLAIERAQREEQRRKADEEERQRRERLAEEMANRPRVSFGMKPLREPQRQVFVQGGTDKRQTAAEDLQEPVDGVEMSDACDGGDGSFEGGYHDAGYPPVESANATAYDAYEASSYPPEFMQKQTAGHPHAYQGSCQPAQYCPDMDVDGAPCHQQHAQHEEHLRYPPQEQEDYAPDGAEEAEQAWGAWGGQQEQHHQEQHPGAESWGQESWQQPQEEPPQEQQRPRQRQSRWNSEQVEKKQQASWPQYGQRARRQEQEGVAAEEYQQSVRTHPSTSTASKVRPAVLAKRAALPPPSAHISPADYYGPRIWAIYEEHNPAKLADVPSLMEKYKGIEAEMYERICLKYSVQMDEPLPPPGSKKPKSRSSRRNSTKESSKAPSASALLARFQTLVGSGDGSSEDEGNAAPPPPRLERGSAGRQASKKLGSREPGPPSSLGSGSGSAAAAERKPAIGSASDANNSRGKAYGSTRHRSRADEPEPVPATSSRTAPIGAPMGGKARGTSGGSNHRGSTYADSRSDEDGFVDAHAADPSQEWGYDRGRSRSRSRAEHSRYQRADSPDADSHEAQRQELRSKAPPMRKPVPPRR